MQTPLLLCSCLHLCLSYPPQEHHLLSTVEFLTWLLLLSKGALSCRFLTGAWCMAIVTKSHPLHLPLPVDLSPLPGCASYLPRTGTASWVCLFWLHLLVLLKYTPLGQGNPLHHLPGWSRPSNWPQRNGRLQGKKIRQGLQQKQSLANFHRSDSDASLSCSCTSPQESSCPGRCWGGAD